MARVRAVWEPFDSVPGHDIENPASAATETGRVTHSLNTNHIMRQTRTEFPVVGGGLTPHSKTQLLMTNESDHPEMDRPSRQLVRLYDKKRDEWRPALACYPAGKGTSYAVLHSAEDYSRPIKCQTKRRYDSTIKHRMKEWDAPPAIKRMVDQAASGTYDELAEAEGYESVYSYIMHIIERSESAPEYLQGQRLAEEVSA